MKADDDGYVTELEYTFRYCEALAPARIALACAARGLAFPRNRPLHYLELAFGQGVSINIHAAAAPGEYWGFDLNPVHVANAQALAGASGANARLTADSFASFAARHDSPQFDVIAMHGTWSWISAENRHSVVEILRKRLSPGGVCLVSYNCLPGWAGELPLRHLMALHAQRAAATQPLGTKIDASLRFAQSLADAGAKYFTAHPGLQAWLENLRSRSRNYLAHEYFNRDWHPMASSGVASAMAGAGLVFGASAMLAGTSDGIGLDAKARELVAGIVDPILRETVLDYFSNTRFRSDLFVKSGSAPDSWPLHERIRSIPFVLLHHPDYLSASVRVGGNEIPLAPEVIRPFAAVMAKNDYSPKSLLEVGATPECAKIPPSQLAEAALVLTEAGYLHPTQSRDRTREAVPRCDMLNAEILKRAGAPNEITALASPVTGAGVFAARKELMFLRALALGHARPDEWARFAWDALGEGDPVTMRSEADAFSRVRLPVFQALGLA
jgi:SAM-dependent methyltransferase